MQQDEIDKIIADAVASSKKQSKWHRGNKKGDSIMRARKILNTIFMVGALFTVIAYFAMPEQRMMVLGVGFVSMAIKIVEFILRFMF